MSEMVTFLLVAVSVAVPAKGGLAILASRRPFIEACKESWFLTITSLRSLRTSPGHGATSIRSSGATVGAVMDLADRRPSMRSAPTQKTSGYAATNLTTGETPVPLKPPQQKGMPPHATRYNRRDTLRRSPRVTPERRSRRDKPPSSTGQVPICQF